MGCTERILVGIDSFGAPLLSKLLFMGLSIKSYTVPEILFLKCHFFAKEMTIIWLGMLDTMYPLLPAISFSLTCKTPMVSGCYPCYCKSSRAGLHISVSKRVNVIVNIFQLLSCCAAPERLDTCPIIYLGFKATMIYVF